MGIDLDGVVDPTTGKFLNWPDEFLKTCAGEVPCPQKIVQLLATYAELSPSGTGVKLFGRGTLPPGGNRRGNKHAGIEMYNSARYFTVTGRWFKESPSALADCTASLCSLHRAVFGDPAKSHVLRRDNDPATATTDADKQLLQVAREAKNGEKFQRLWGGQCDDYSSPSEADLALAGMLAFWTGPDPAIIERLMRQSGLYREKWERSDYLRSTIDKALQNRREFFNSGADDGQQPTAITTGPKKPAKTKQLSIATTIVDLARDCLLWHTRDGAGYATMPVNGHTENWPIKSKGLRLWLKEQYYRTTKSVPAKQAVEDALDVLEAKATFDGPEEKVHLRIAENGSSIFLDLCDAEWRAVEITPEGWRVTQNPPVRFRRCKAMGALPEPQIGCFEELRRFVNVADEKWPLIVAWQVAALMPRGPYAVLCVHGEQGSAKSTTARVLRDLIDPNGAPLRCEPKDPRDLMIAANNGRVIALDNISHLSPWLSDAICRLATGGGFSTRTLYENDEETIFDAQRPVILAGIEEIVTRSDLLDRSVIVNLQSIAESRRRPEAEFWREFQEAKPRLLGALFDVVAGTLRNLPAVHPPTLPRMADFVVCGMAAEQPAGLTAGDFIRAYTGNQDEANELALESSPIGRAVLDLIATTPSWRSSASDLLDRLNVSANEQTRRLSNWPKDARSLSGTLSRLTPNLRRAGVEVDIGRESGGIRRRFIRLTRTTSETCVPTDAGLSDGTQGPAMGTNTGTQ
jgi:hypothetical protein